MSKNRWDTTPQCVKQYLISGYGSISESCRVTDKTSCRLASVVSRDERDTMEPWVSYNYFRFLVHIGLNNDKLYVAS